MHALLLACALASTGLPAVPIDVEGAQVLAPDVYLAVLELPDDAKADAATAALVQQQLQAFLKKSGYELADVQVGVAGDRLLVHVQEGVLEKVVFRGRLTFQMLRLKLGLDLPREVFNRPQLERELARLARQLSIDMPSYELVATEEVKHQGPQVVDLGPLAAIKGLALVHPQADYELHVFFAEREWTTGPGLDVRASYFDGFELGLNYQGRSLFMNDDRWRVGLMGGVGLREDLPDQALYAFPSRLFAEAQWYTPALDDAKRVRPFVWLRGEGLARQRQDLRLENYYSTNSELSLNVGVRPFESLDVFVGWGLQHYFVFGLTGVPADPPPAPVAEPHRFRSFFQVRGELVFNTGNARWDRRHALWLDGRLYSNLRRIEQPSFAELRGGYQKVFGFGWHDLWVKAKGMWVTGDVLFPFEEPLGDHLRGVFGDVWVRVAGGLRAEFRFSLTRDLYKLGLFVDGAAYGELDRVTNVNTPRFGIAFGPSFHALIEGMFQMDLALSFGLLDNGRFDTGVNAVLLKVF